MEVQFSIRKVPPVFPTIWKSNAAAASSGGSSSRSSSGSGSGGVGWLEGSKKTNLVVDLQKENPTPLLWWRLVESQSVGLDKRAISRRQAEARHRGDGFQARAFFKRPTTETVCIKAGSLWDWVISCSLSVYAPWSFLGFFSPELLFPPRPTRKKAKISWTVGQLVGR